MDFREGGPVFEKAMEIILAEHDRRSALEQAAPRRRRGDRQGSGN